MKVNVNQTHGLFHLTFVCFTLVLQTVYVSLETLNGLLILLRIECYFFDTSVLLADVLGDFSVASLFHVQVSFQIPDLLTRNKLPD